MSNWDTSSTTTMTSMFYNAKNFRGTGVDLWNTAKVVNMGSMFAGATIFDADLGNANDVTGIWKTSLVTTMRFMFGNTDSFTGVGLGKLDISAICSNCTKDSESGVVNMFSGRVGLTSCSKRNMLDGWKSSTSEG